jgi:hypothetical protein
MNTYTDDLLVSLSKDYPFPFIFSWNLSIKPQRKLYFFSLPFYRRLTHTHNTHSFRYFEKRLLYRRDQT